MRRLRTTLVGLGAIGRALLVELAAAPELEIVAVADPAFAGRRIAEVVSVPLELIVAPSAASSYETVASDVAVLCTGSFVTEMAAQVAEALGAGRRVVTTCEELGNPSLHPACGRLDALARDLGLAVLATGVNPGLVMDRLPLLLAQACVRVDCVRIGRYVDVSLRRGELQRKVGVGLTAVEFEERARAGRFGHIGLAESAALVARGLGVRMVVVAGSLEPVLAEDDSRGVPRGRVLGIRQRATAGPHDKPGFVTLDLEMSLRYPSPRDEVHIDGDPPIHLTIDGGVMGDRATLGTMKNALAVVRDATPGLHTVADLPLFGLLR